MPLSLKQQISWVNHQPISVPPSIPGIVYATWIGNALHVWWMIRALHSARQVPKNALDAYDHLKKWDETLDKQECAYDASVYNFYTHWLFRSYQWNARKHVLLKRGFDLPEIEARMTNRLSVMQAAESRLDEYKGHYGHLESEARLMRGLRSNIIVQISIEEPALADKTSEAYCMPRWSFEDGARIWGQFTEMYAQECHVDWRSRKPSEWVPEVIATIGTGGIEAMSNVLTKDGIDCLWEWCFDCDAILSEDVLTSIICATESRRNKEQANASTRNQALVELSRLAGIAEARYDWSVFAGRPIWLCPKTHTPFRVGLVDDATHRHEGSIPDIVSGDTLVDLKTTARPLGKPMLGQMLRYVFAVKNKLNPGLKEAQIYLARRGETLAFHADDLMH